MYDAEIGTEDPHLARAWSALTGRHRAVLELRELGGLSYDEIAVALAVTSGAVETLLFRARTALRREYARAGGKVAAMGPIEEAVQRATGGKGMLTRLAEQAGTRFGDGAGAAASAAGSHGQAMAGAASNGSAVMSSSGATPSWLLDLQARLAAGGVLDPVVQQAGAGGGRLRMALAGLGVLLGTVAVTAPSLDTGSTSKPSTSAPPPAAVTVPSTPTTPTAPAAPAEATAPTTTAPAAPEATAPTTPTTTVGGPPATEPSTLGTPIVTTATTVVGTVSAVVEGVVDPVVEGVEDVLDTVLGLPRR